MFRAGANTTLFIAYKVDKGLAQIKDESFGLSTLFESPLFDIRFFWKSPLQILDLSNKKGLQCFCVFILSLYAFYHSCF
jgi:hypothetical protein